jgi:hypothetical protein
MLEIDSSAVKSVKHRFIFAVLNKKLRNYNYRVAMAG